MYIIDTRQTPRAYLAILDDDTFMFSTDRKEDDVLIKLQRGLNSVETWCKLWNITVNEDKIRAVYFSNRLRPPEVHLTLNGLNIPFMNHVKYLGVILGKRITWRLHIEMIETKAFRTFIRVYSLFESERLSAIIKLTLHTALIRSVMTYAFPAWEFVAATQPSQLQRLHKVLRTIGKFSRCTQVRQLHMAFQAPYIYDYITKLCR
jgi:hypothetical protein